MAGIQVRIDLIFIMVPLGEQKQMEEAQTYKTMAQTYKTGRLNIFSFNTDLTNHLFQ